MTSSEQKENTTMRTTLGGVALLLTISVTATGCGGTTDSTTPPASSSPAAPSSSSTPQDPRSQAAAAAQAMVRKYFTVTDLIGQDPSTPLSLLKTIDVSFVLSTDQHTFSSWRAKGWRKTGNLKVTKMQVETISLDNSDPAKGVVPYVAVAVCTDASGVDVVDQAGKSVVLKTRPTLLTTRYTVANYHWETDRTNGWRVAGIRDEEVGKCTL